MKKIFSLFLFLLTVIAFDNLHAEVKVEFASTSHDFGNVKAGKGPVTAIYEFTNTGDEPLTVAGVTNGGCHCTKPQYPKKPILPGKKGQIKVSFNPAGYSGEFKRSIKVKINSLSPRITLTFNGAVIP